MFGGDDRSELMARVAKTALCEAGRPDLADRVRIIPARMFHDADRRLDTIGIWTDDGYVYEQDEPFWQKARWHATEAAARMFP